MLVAAVVLVLVIRDSAAAPPPPPAEVPAAAAPPAKQATREQATVEPATPPAASADDEARARVRGLWAELQERLLSTGDDPGKCVEDMRGFAAAHRDVWLPPDFDVRLKDYETAAAWRAAAARDLPPAVPPPEETKPVEPQPPSTVQAETRDFPQPRETQREEDFVRLCAAVRAHSYRPGLSLDSLARMAAAWLASYPEESDRRPLVRLIAESFLPALDECVAKLVANQKVLVGKPIRLDKRREASVHELSIERPYLLHEDAAWLPARMGVLGRHPRSSHAADALSLRIRRAGGIHRRPPVLPALALTSREDKWWSAAAAGLPESPELLHWQRFRDEYEKASTRAKPWLCGIARARPLPQATTPKPTDWHASFAAGAPMSPPDTWRIWTASTGSARSPCRR